ncbi:MAG: hypothetical protein ACYC6N_05000 [Pirellulaceae bacterium]
MSLPLSIYRSAGIMAIQKDFIPCDALIEIMGDWVVDMSRRLGQALQPISGRGVAAIEVASLH